MLAHQAQPFMLLAVFAHGRRRYLTAEIEVPSLLARWIGVSSLSGKGHVAHGQDAGQLK